MSDLGSLKLLELTAAGLSRPASCMHLASAGPVVITDDSSVSCICALCATGAEVIRCFHHVQPPQAVTACLTPYAYTTKSAALNHMKNVMDPEGCTGISLVGCTATSAVLVSKHVLIVLTDSLTLSEAHMEQCLNKSSAQTGPNFLEKKIFKCSN